MLKNRRWRLHFSSRHISIRPLLRIWITLLVSSVAAPRKVSSSKVTRQCTWLGAGTNSVRQTGMGTLVSRLAYWLECLPLRWHLFAYQLWGNNSKSPPPAVEKKTATHADRLCLSCRWAAASGLGILRALIVCDVCVLSDPNHISDLCFDPLLNQFTGENKHQHGE